MVQHLSYHGLRYARKYIAKKIKTMCPDCLYVEPFSGHAWVWSELQPEEAVLGDPDCSVFDWIREHHKSKVEENPPKMVCQDWEKTVKKYDSKKTVFVFDPPWKECGGLSKGCGLFDKEKVIEVAKKVKGKAIVTLNPKTDYDVLCKGKGFKCKRLNIEHGNMFKYLIGIKN